MFALAAARAPLALRPSTAAPRTQSRRSLVVRASEGEKETPSTGTVFYKGNALSEEEVSFRRSRHTYSLKQHAMALLTTCRAFCVAAVWQGVAAGPPPPRAALPVARPPEHFAPCSQPTTPARHPFRSGRRPPLRASSPLPHLTTL